MLKPWAFTPGMILGARYRMLAPLGRGSMGEVWRAQHVSLGVEVAVKTIDPELMRQPGVAGQGELLERFQREAQAAAALSSVHVVKVHDHGIERGIPYMAMELLVGETLGDRLTRQGRLGFEETVRVMTHVSRAITKAHEIGVVHRDLKPQNVFLARGEEEEIAKVLDFGIAKLTTSPMQVQSRETNAARMIGTPAYMSPELVSGSVAVDGRVDLWAMAVMTFECVIGRLPIVSDNVGEIILAICTRPMPTPSSLAPVPRAFDAWFARATHRDSSQRYPTAKVMVDALRLAIAPHLANLGTNEAARSTAGHPGTQAGLVGPVPAAEPRSKALIAGAIGLGLVAGLAGLVVMKVHLDRTAAAQRSAEAESAPAASALTEPTAAASATAEPSSSAATSAAAASASATTSAVPNWRKGGRRRVDPRLGL